YSTWLNKSFQLLNSSSNFNALGDATTMLCFKIVSKVPDSEDTILFKMDSQEIIYIVDMFRDTLHLPVETPDNLFIAPVNINVIESFMQKVGYQGVVDNVKEYQENDKIESKPDKNGKRVEARKSLKQLQLKEEEKPKKIKKEWPKTHTRIKSYSRLKKRRKEKGQK
nr:hypothetical protein [Tanacetum cinerariifolium]